MIFGKYDAAVVKDIAPLLAWGTVLCLPDGRLLAWETVLCLPDGPSLAWGGGLVPGFPAHICTPET